MSDLMASAFATFLDQRKTKHHNHHTLAPPSVSPPSTHHVLHPPLHPPPFPKRQRNSFTYIDSSLPISLEQHTSPLIPLKETSSFLTYPNNEKQPSTAILPSADWPHNSPETNHHHRTTPRPSGPMIGGVPILNSSQPSSLQIFHNNVSNQSTLPKPLVHEKDTSQSRIVRMSSLSAQTLSLLNDAPPQKPKSTTPRPFACRHEGCSASFIKQNHLSRHVRIVHNKERPYQCTQPGCGSRFGSKSHLGDHTRAVHMRIKLFKCEMCNASWSKRFNLKKHIRVRHLGEKPYRCQQCQISFGTRSHATRHELKVHKRSFAEGLPDRKANVCI